MTYKLRTIEQGDYKTPYAVLVGCGGTGGFVAEGLCRLLEGTNFRLALIDHDRVEERNLGRQNFYQQDLGRFKAQVLAERLARDYNREVEYETQPIEALPINERGALTIGCVDNPRARERLQYAGSGMMGQKYCYCDIPGWYIDAGNGENSGQVLIGNALLRQCQHSFMPANGICEKLPIPTVQQPALLAPEAVRRDCAEAVAANLQSPIINRMMADLVLTFVHKLLTGSLTWMGAYLDLEAGTLSTVPADPETVSRMTGYTVKQLEYRPRERVRVNV